jgi:hypothetical protein
VTTNRDVVLEEVIAGIQKRWGMQMIGQGVPKAAANHTPTGFEKLDRVIGDGIPRSNITSVWGLAGASGRMSLAYRIIASAQRRGEVVVFNDFPNTFDHQYAKNYGVDFDWLLLVYPNDWLHALELTRDVIALPCTGLMVLDAGVGDPPIKQHLVSLSGALERLNSVLHKSRWTLLLLVPLEGNSFPDSSVALRLIAKQVGVLREYGDICGYRVEVTVAKNKFRPAGQTAIIDIYID